MKVKVAPLQRTRGQAMVEYMVVVAALTFALFYPITDASSPDQPRTTVQIMINGFRQAYENISAALSIPE
ncbi:hypothetical protein [Aquabacterium sp.]|uniref:hypothetical protein n=1 Tax=Aquabacterium sp. TaxID=1872578 RepID=UPI00199B292D|nr:hypothetical protein [Aquabacterium sp.]MBC7699452.1 hypothetical protein [Aquabacterium sp.]